VKSSLREIVKDAFEVSAKAFVEIVDDATELLLSEDGIVGNREVTGRLVTMNHEGSSIVIGDIHGDLESLVEILSQSDCLNRMKKNRDFNLIFLGDYGDRGVHSVEVYYVVLTLKVLYPEQTLLMRGNHEVSEPGLTAVPHDLPFRLRSRFGQGSNVYEELKKVFPALHNAVLVRDRYLMVHGGLSPAIRSFEDIAFAKIGGPNQSLLEDLLWSDPEDTIHGGEPSPRGAGTLFGEDVTRRVLQDLNVRLLIRGHEPAQEGFKMNHHGKVLTLFSRRGSPYFNAFGAYLDVDLSANVDSAQQLIPYIHKF
jgi:diadenosine tetraphosphatase ApaH/serine/threonine PP2A family protein phosphatase